MELYHHILIKGMVCSRCVVAIQTGLEKLGYPISSVSLGKIVFEQAIEAPALLLVEKLLQQLGFAVLSDRHALLLQQIKMLVNEYITYDLDELERLKFSRFLSEKLHLNYDSLSALFSNQEGITLEKYIIQKRLERVHQMLLQTDDSLTEIAYQTGYSSVHHLSHQFKKNYGFSPSRLRLGEQSLHSPAEIL